MLQEKEVRSVPGWLMVVLLLLTFGGSIVALATAEAPSPSWITLWIFVIVLALVSFLGLTIVNPNQATVMTLFGTYKGSLKHSGFWWVNPLTMRRRISLRIDNSKAEK